MRIAFVIWGYEYFGGMERRYIRLARKLGESTSNKIFVLCRNVSRKSVEIVLINSSVEVIDIGSSSSGIIKDTLDLLKIIRNIKPDHVHLCINPSVTSFIFAMIHWFLPPFSLSMADSTFEENMKRLDVLYAKFSVKRSLGVDCISEETSRILSKYIDAKDRHKLKVAPCSFTDPSRRLGSVSRDIDVIVVARFIEGKGYELIEQIATEISHLKICICGFGSRIPNIPGAEIVRTENSFEFLSRSKIFLSLQKKNNYPSQSLLEAMVCECAVVATDVGETRRIVDEECAVLIPYDATSLRDAIFFLISNPEKAMEIGRNARERIIKHHTIERYMEYFLEEIVGDS